MGMVTITPMLKASLMDMVMLATPMATRMDMLTTTTNGLGKSTSSDRGCESAFNVPVNRPQ
jgi:hypothetical protein